MKAAHTPDWRKVARGLRKSVNDLIHVMTQVGGTEQELATAAARAVADAREALADYTTAEESVANARLTSAAPEMLDTLKRIRELLGRSTLAPDPGIVAEIDAVVAKAVAD